MESIYPLQNFKEYEKACKELEELEAKEVSVPSPKSGLTQEEALRMIGLAIEIVYYEKYYLGK